MTYDVLNKTAQKVWRGITPVYLKNLYQGMQRRMAAGIEAQGGHNKYWCCILHFKHNELVNELINLQGDALLMSKIVPIYKVGHTTIERLKAKKIKVIWGIESNLCELRQMRKGTYTNWA